MHQVSVHLCFFDHVGINHPQVRYYVEGTRNATQLLDLISASGDEVEPTKATAARQAMYPEVGFYCFFCLAPSLN